MSELEQISFEAKGFIAAQIGRPFESCPVIFVTRDEMASELSEVIEEFFQNREGKGSRIGEGIERKITERSMGFFSKRILGLYSQRYFSSYQNKILLVQENIENVSRQLEIDYDKMLVWVASHEMMHGAQFNGDSALKKVIQEKITSLASQKKINAENIKEIRAWMTWIEGSADFVMDFPGLLEEKELQQFRIKMNDKRAARSFNNLLLRLLGNKTSQYTNGAKLVESAYREVGKKALLAPIENPLLLPKPEEIECPKDWATRLSS